ncbi:hypothetical protein M2302_002197 [Micromonospora sp. A200]|nr:hypothetical protein [Micromonospora sp. A200]
MQNPTLPRLVVAYAGPASGLAAYLRSLIAQAGGAR